MEENDTLSSTLAPRPSDAERLLEEDLVDYDHIYQKSLARQHIQMQKRRRQWTILGFLTLIASLSLSLYFVSQNETSPIGKGNTITVPPDQNFIHCPTNDDVESDENCSRMSEYAPKDGEFFCHNADAAVRMPWSMMVCSPQLRCNPFSCGKGEAVIGLHGGPGGSSGYLAPLLSLADRMPVILYDQASSGRSYTLSENLLIGDNVAESLNLYVAELHRIIQFYTVSKAHLVGHSFGAMIALEYYKKYPLFVGSLTLLSPFVDSKMWMSDARFHTTFLRDESGNRYSDESKGSEELQRRWVISDDDLRLEKNLFCKHNSNIYDAIWGPNEDHVTGQVKDYSSLQSMMDAAANGVPILLGSGLIDEAAPLTVLELEYMALHTSIVIPGKKKNVKSVFLPHSKHVPFLRDWKIYLQSIATVVNINQDRDMPEALVPSLVDYEVLTGTLAALRSTLVGYEASESVIVRSYTYLGRLLADGPVAPGILVQDAGVATLTVSQNTEAGDFEHFDLIQAVLDVWYIAVVSGYSEKDIAALKPPDKVIGAVVDYLKKLHDKPNMTSYEAVQWFILAKSLNRCHVVSQPIVAADEWKRLEKRTNMSVNDPIPYVYLLTHVYLYNTDFGTVKAEGDNEQAINDATKELLKYIPLFFDNSANNYQLLFRKSGDEAEATAYDGICEMLFTVSRVYGSTHPISVALSTRLQIFLSDSSFSDYWKPDGEANGHLQVVCLVAWKIWSHKHPLLH